MRVPMLPLVVAVVVDFFLLLASSFLKPFFAFLVCQPQFNKKMSQKQGKKRKREEEEECPLAKEKKYFVQLIHGDSKTQTGPTIEVDSEFTSKQLSELVNVLLNNQEELPYGFYLDTDEIQNNIRETLLASSKKNDAVSTQDAPLQILYLPQAIFKVRPVTRCSATMPGHSEAILSVAFSPDGNMLASASGGMKCICY